MTILPHLTVILCCLGLRTAFQTRINFILIWIQHFMLNTGTDQNQDPIRIQSFDDQKMKKIYTVLRIRGNLSPIRDPTFSIPDPRSDFIHLRSRIRIKEFKYFNPQKCFLSSNPGCSFRVVDSGSRIRILTFYRSRIPNPGI